MAHAALFGMIIPGVASQVLAAELASETDRPLLSVARDQFPDGERIVELETAPGEAAIIVASTVSSDAHIDLLLLQDAAREEGVTELITVIPYLGYARQDSAFESGQPVSVRAMARAISTGTDRVITVNPHEPGVIDHFGVPAEAVDATGSLAAGLPDDLHSPVFLGPDAGARSLASRLRDLHGTGTADHLEKIRHSGRRVEISPTDASISDRDVVLVDDIIATGGTMVEAIHTLRNQGANRIIVTTVHPLLAEDAYARLKQAGIDMLVGTDTLERPVSTVSVAGAVTEALF